MRALDLPDWRDAPAYVPILARGRSALAWEVLRRDPGYAAAWRHGQDSAEHWGLHFRV